MTLVCPPGEPRVMYTYPLLSPTVTPLLAMSPAPKFSEDVSPWDGIEDGLTLSQPARLGLTTVRMPVTAVAVGSMPCTPATLSGRAVLWLIGSENFPTRPTFVRVSITRTGLIWCRWPAVGL